MPVQERRAQRTHPEYKKPELMATAPNQVWSWDITRLLGPKKWSYYYLYVIMDIYSRYVVGWMVADRENSALAGRLIQRCDGGKLAMASVEVQEAIQVEVRDAVAVGHEASLVADVLPHPLHTDIAL